MSKLGEGRGSLRFNTFKNHENDWLFKRTLLSIIEKGAEIGECLYVASRIKENDGESWVTEWSKMAEKIESHGAKSLQNHHEVSARECFLRSSTYYRIAEYFCTPDHPRFHELWTKSRNAFHQACMLFKPQIEIVNIPFEGKFLPGYFWRQDDSDIKRPTFISVGGNDDSGEEVFFWNGPAAVRRGYNYFTFEPPGHRGTVHLYSDLVKRPDYEVPFSAAIDFLQTLPGVDERIALAGHSHGGYAVIRTALYEPRIKAVIPSTPLINGNKGGEAMFGGLLKLMPKALIDKLIQWKLKKKPALNAILQYTIWTLGYSSITDLLSDKQEKELNFSIEGEESAIECAALSLVGENEGQELLRQTKQFHKNISSLNKELKIFTLQEDGSDDHCQLDNRSRANQVIFDWLDNLFDYRSNIPM